MSDPTKGGKGFFLRGFGCTDKEAHYDHLRHLADAVSLLESRWTTPPATTP